MPAPHTGNISVDPNIGGYQGPTESSGVTGGVSGTAGNAPEYQPALPPAGGTTYNTANSGPSMESLAAAQEAMQQRINQENEAKARKKDQGIISSTQKKQAERRSTGTPVAFTQTQATGTRRTAADDSKSNAKSQTQQNIRRPKEEEPVVQEQAKGTSLKPEILAKESGTEELNHGQSYDDGISEKKVRQRQKKEDVDYYTQAQSKTRSKQFKKESKPKPRPNPAKDTPVGQWQGPVASVTPEGVVGIGEQRHVTEMPLPYGGELPINAIVKRNMDQSIIPLSNERRIAADPNRPNVVIPPRFNGFPMGDGSPAPKLLPGQTGYYTYVASRNQNDKRKEEEIIDDSIRMQAENADFQQMYPNAVDVNTNYVTYEDFTNDYNQGVGEDGEDLRAKGRYGENVVARSVARMKQSVARIVQWYHQAYIPLASEHVDERGNIRYSDETEAAIVNYMNHMGLAPEERYIVMQQAVKALGLTPDRDGLFFKSSKREKINDQVFIEALNNMMVSCAEYGHPYGFVNRGMFLGGTRCYPIGVMTYHEAEVLCKSGHIFEGQDPYELMSKTAETWLNETLPTIRKNIYRQNNGEAQMLVLEDFVRAICSLDGISPRKYGVADEIDRGYEQMVAETVPGYKLNEDEDDRAVNDRRRRQLDLFKRRYERSFDRLDRIRNRVYQVYDEDVVDDNGVVLHRKGDKVGRNDEPNLARTRYIRNPKENAFSSVCLSVANMAKFAGVVGYVPIMASGIVEHAQGNVNTKVANGILFGRNKTYRPNDEMYAHITSEAGIEAIAAWKSLIHVGGQDALIMFHQEYNVLNKENASKFLRDFVKREGSQATAPRKAREIMARMEEAVHWLMPGDIGFGAADARRWLEGYMLNNMYNSGNANSMIADVTGIDSFRGDQLGLDYSFTADQVLEMMNSMGIERFVAAATESNAGRDAMLMARNQTFDRISPITYIVDSMLRRSGVTNMFVTLGIDTYFTYGLNLVQMMIPFSNTSSYLAVKGINMLATGGRNNTDQLDLNIMNYQMGGNDAFGAGLKKNLVYDCVKLGNICLIAGFMYFVIKALGFDEPEATWNKYVWSEYRIGKNLNLGSNDENGNPTGIPVYAAWWLNDLTMFALPMAYALNARDLDQKLGDNDPELANKLFFSGCHDMLSGCSLLDLMKTVNNAQKDFTAYEQMMQDPDMKCPPDWFSFGALQAELFCARGVNKFVPNALKSLRTDTLIVGEDALDHDAYKVYNRESEDPGKTEYVEDWFELQRRIESKYNPIYALYNNLTKNGYLFDDGSTGKTGYLFDEMPIATAKDPQRMTWAHKYDFDPDNIPGGEDNRIAYTEEMIEKVVADIDSFNSVDEALSQGYMIPYQLRFKMRDYCYQRINFEENLFNQRLQEGWLPTAEYEDAKSQMKEKQSYWYDILNNWVFNSDIPWTDEGYAKLITSSQDIYYYKDSGKPATKFDYWQLGPETIEQRFLPRGDHPTSFMPFTTPDNRGRVFDYQTRANWFKEGESGSNLQEIFNRNQEASATVPYGRDTDVYTNTAVFGGDPRFKTNEPIEANSYLSTNQASMGYRAYVPWEDEFLFNLPNFNGYINEDGKLVRGNGSKVSTTQAIFDGLKAKDRKDVDGNSSMGDMGIYKDKDEWKKSSYPSYSKRSWGYGGRSYYSRGGSGGSNYNPRIYSTKAQSTHNINSRVGSTRTNPDARSINADRAATMYSKTPGSTHVNTYLRPSFSTKGSREAYKRQDI